MRARLVLAAVGAILLAPQVASAHPRGASTRAPRIGGTAATAPAPRRTLPAIVCS
jgi:hypothetical protein